jgi:FG-GAP repeat.
MVARGPVVSIAGTRLLALCFVVSSFFAAEARAGALSANPVWTNELFQAEAWNGVSVDSAGDINRDGFDDVIVGAPYYDTPLLAAGAGRALPPR